MRLYLKKYKSAKTYSNTYNHNFKEINSIESKPFFNSLIKKLTKFTEISEDIIYLDLKRYLMTSTEYLFDINLKTSLIHHLIYPAFMQSCLKRLISLNRKQSYDKFDIIIDDHYDGGMIKGFFGAEFLFKIKSSFKYGIINSQKPMKICLKDIIFSLLNFYRCLKISRNILKFHKINLRKYIFNFFLLFLSGNYIKRKNKPMLIISAYDNGFPIIFGKATGADIMLIQNGKRTISSEASFIYADYYISMGEHKNGFNMKNLTGCVFKNLFIYGSIRLYNAYKKYNLDNIEKEFDILWISNLQSRKNKRFIEIYNHLFPLSNAYEATSLLNELADSGKYTIGYQTRRVFEEKNPFKAEINELKELGLYSEKIHYIDGNKQNVYISLMKSDLVLSVGSTVIEEALGIGKKVGFVNKSGNEYLNYNFKCLNNEYNSKSNISFNQFVEELMAREDLKKYNYQNFRYIDDLILIIAKINNYQI